MKATEYLSLGRKGFYPQQLEEVTLMYENEIFVQVIFYDILGIKLEDRKIFRNYIDDVVSNKTHTFITKKYSNKVRPTNVSKGDPYYDYYN